jgi:hypothetical protein
MSKHFILAAALVAVAAIAGSAQARPTERIDDPAAAPRPAGEIQLAAMSAYLRLQGQKAGTIKGPGAQAAPATIGPRKKSVRGRGGLVMEE